MKRDAGLRRLQTLNLMLLIALGPGCDESLYAPSSEAVPCGTEDLPCPFTCELECAATVVDMASSCMQSLQGTLNSAGTRCDFPDGSQAAFAWPVPDVGADLSARSWKLTLRRPDSQGPCISVTSEPLPWVAGGFRSETSVQTESASYSQELSMRSDGVAAVDDSGAALPDPSRLLVHCPDGRFFRGEGRAICAECSGSDCRKLPLVELRAGWNGPTLDFELRAGDRITPLFSCL